MFIKSSGQLQCVKGKVETLTIFTLLLYKMEMLLSATYHVNFHMLTVSEERWIDSLPSFRKKTMFIRFEAMGVGILCLLKINKILLWILAK